MDIGTALRHLRDDLGLTQKQMIQGTKITVSHYSKLEKGQNRIFIENLVEIFLYHILLITILMMKIVKKK